MVLKKSAKQCRTIIYAKLFMNGRRFTYLTREIRPLPWCITFFSLTKLVVETFLISFQMMFPEIILQYYYN